MYVDTVDAKILVALQGNGRATLDELSRATGRSSSQCQRRQKRLENAGIIKRYVALVAPDTVGFPVQVFMLVSIDRDGADTYDRFERAAFPSLKSVTTFAMLEEIEPGFAVPVEPVGDEDFGSRER